jgi:hypothetical protein
LRGNCKKGDLCKNFLDDWSNSGPAVRRDGRRGVTNPPESRSRCCSFTI